MKKYYYGKGDDNRDDDYEVIYPEGASSEEEYEKYLPYFDEVDGDYKYMPAEDEGAAPRRQGGLENDPMRLMLEKIEELNSRMESRAQDDYRIDELDREIRSLKEQLYQLRGKDDLKRQLDELKKELLQEKERIEERPEKRQPEGEEPRQEPVPDLDAERIIREIEKLNIGGYDKNLEGKFETIVDKRVADAVKAASQELKNAIKQYFEELREESGRLVESALSKSELEGEALDEMSRRLSEHEESVTASLDEYKAKLTDALLKLSEFGEKLEPKGVIDRDSLYAETMLDALSDIKGDLRNALKESEDLKAALKEIEERLSQLADSGQKLDDELQLAFSDFAQALTEQGEEKLSGFEGKMNSLSESFRAAADELKRFISLEVDSKFSQQNLEDFKKELSNALSLELKTELELMRQDYSILFGELGSQISSLKEQLSKGEGAKVERLNEFKESMEERFAALEEKVEASGSGRLDEDLGALREKFEERLSQAIDKLDIARGLEDKLAAALGEIKAEAAQGDIGEKIEELKRLVEALRDSRSLDYDLSRIYTELRKLSGSKGLFGENFEKAGSNIAQLKEELADISVIEQENREGK
jgi:DNA repair exonuclease SbcCD ATPase subunit